MENSYQYDELLVKYLLNEVDDDELAKVIAWKNLNEDNLRYFEEVTKAWKLSTLQNSIKDINTDYEWRQLHQKIALKKLREEHPGCRLEVTDVKRPARNINISRIILSTAVAASILLTIAIGFVFFGNNKKIEPLAQEVIKKTEPFVRHEKNTSGKSKSFLLDDGSRITLFDSSEISFQYPFPSDKREITLVGKALFNVGKDKTKPFTVFSGSLSTTALGTKFSVTSFLHHNIITVRLLEGKVAVNTNYNVSKNADSNFYLFAGQELIYNNLSATANVKTLSGKSVGVERKHSDEKLFIDTLAIPVNEHKFWFMFNNQSLDKVFDELEKIYAIGIDYSNRDIHNRYFIGKFDKEDSIEKILEQIALLNNLKVNKKNNRFIITKHSRT